MSDHKFSLAGAASAGVGLFTFLGALVTGFFARFNSKEPNKVAAQQANTAQFDALSRSADGLIENLEKIVERQTLRMDAQDAKIEEQGIKIEQMASTIQAQATEITGLKGTVTKQQRTISMQAKKITNLQRTNKDEQELRHKQVADRDAEISELREKIEAQGQKITGRPTV